MNKQEFAAWQRVTKESETTWIFDYVQWKNHHNALWYLGGQDGVFISVDHDGTAMIGNYEGAIPCITDAMFIPLHIKKFELGIHEAIKHVLTKLGLFDQLYVNAKVF